MLKTIALIGTMDTKGDQIDYLRQMIIKRGQKPMVVDVGVGVLQQSSYKADISSQMIAEAANTHIEAIRAYDDEEKAMNKMTEGAIHVLKECHENGELDGVLSVGGSMGTVLALKLMKVLPLGLPKAIISTIAYSHAIDPDLLGGDIVMIPWTGGLWGINEMARSVLKLAAASISAQAEVYQKEPQNGKKRIAVTSLGMASSRYMFHLKPALEKRGYDVMVFHATGISPKILERAAVEGWFEAVLDLKVGQEILDHVCGSLFSPGPHRLEPILEKGIPVIVSPGNIETCLWSPYKQLPRKYKGRAIFHHNEVLWVIETNQSEKVAAAKLLAKKLNMARGPAAMVIPKGKSSGSRRLEIKETGGIQLYIDELRKRVKPEIEIIEMDEDYDAPEFTGVIIRLLEEMIDGP